MAKVKMVPPQYKKGGSRSKPEPFDLVDAHKYQYEGPNDMIFHHFVGQTVQKIKGYKYPGIILVAFKTLDGKARYVVEADHPDFRGMLHIFSDNDIEER
jgi:hypothetical protein